ncbi:uncharacterized protein LOC128387899 [Panonychus citri]|uniref:uncharacterized protein LOC128387899 n=1 Tax=Panonychus citri TaxID=50023 RepID=UPI002307E2DF|nr:uncharacterized protein LOC128387899 [Panonychus citri]
MKIQMTTNLKVAVYSTPPYSTCDSHHCIGPLASYTYRRLSLVNQFNYTIVGLRTADYGICDGDNCSGIIGFIQRGEADIALHSYPLSAVPSHLNGITLGPVLDEVSCNIFSSPQSPLIIREDVLRSMSIFSSSKVIIFFGFLLLLLSLFPLSLHNWTRKSKPRPKTILGPLVFTFFGQESSSVALLRRNKFSSILLLLSFISLLLSIIYSGSFTTDLTSLTQPKLIDSLDDVIEASKHDHCVVSFLSSKCSPVLKSGTSNVYQQVRNVTIFGSYSKLLPLILDQVGKRKSLDNHISLSTIEESDRLRLTLCNTIYVKSGHWYRSQPPFSAPATDDYYKHHLSKFLDPIDAGGCLHKTALRHKNNLYEVFGYQALIFGNYTKSFIYFGLGLLITIIVFMFECLSKLIVKPSIMNDLPNENTNRIKIITNRSN